MTIQDDVNTILSEKPNVETLEEKVDELIDDALFWFGGEVGGYFIEDKRNEIKNFIRRAMEGDHANNQSGLNDLWDGLSLPVTLIEVANNWRSIGGHVDEGNTERNMADISDRWFGPAHDAYKIVWGDQGKAFQGLSALCVKTAEKLEELAVRIQNYYATIAIGVVDLVSSILTDLAGLASFRLFDGLGNIKDSVEAAANLIVTGITETKNVANEITIALNNITQSFTQFGWPQQTWPASSTAKYTDMTVSDNNAAWSVKTDRYYQ